MTAVLAMRPRGLATSTFTKVICFCTGIMTIVGLVGAAIGRAPAGNLKGALAFALATALLWKFARVIRTPLFPKASPNRPLHSGALASSYGMPAWYEISIWIAVSAAFIATFAIAIYYMWPSDLGILKVGSLPVITAFLLCGRESVAWLRSRMRRRFPDVPQIWSEESALVFGGVEIPWNSIARVWLKKDAPILKSDLIQVDARGQYMLKTAAIQTIALVDSPEAIVAEIRSEAIRRGARLQSQEGEMRPQA